MGWELWRRAPPSTDGPPLPFFGKFDLGNLQNFCSEHKFRGLAISGCGMCQPVSKYWVARFGGWLTARLPGSCWLSAPHTATLHSFHHSLFLGLGGSVGGNKQRLGNLAGWGEAPGVWEGLLGIGAPRIHLPRTLPTIVTTITSLDLCNPSYSREAHG